MDASQQRLRSLALSDTGFLFDPITGHTYTLNRTGGEIFKLLRDGMPAAEIPPQIADRFEVAADEAERDCAFFIRQLHEYRLLEA